MYFLNRYTTSVGIVWEKKLERVRVLKYLSEGENDF